MKGVGLLIVLFLSAIVGYGQNSLAQKSVQDILAYNLNQMVALGEAFPEEKFNWRPMEGVNSVGESYLHMASANYYLISKLGFPPPEDVDLMNLSKITGKGNIIKAFQKSFAFTMDKIMMVNTDEFGNEVDLGFAKMNRLQAILQIMEHNAEHKGQLIAYARMNDIVPPWSK